MDNIEIVACNRDRSKDGKDSENVDGEVHENAKDRKSISAVRTLFLKLEYPVQQK